MRQIALTRDYPSFGVVAPGEIPNLFGRSADFGNHRPRVVTVRLAPGHPRDGGGAGRFRQSAGYMRLCAAVR